MEYKIEARENLGGAAREACRSRSVGNWQTSWGWCVIADPHVWSTAVVPMRAPRCWGSAAIVIIVSDAARNSRS